MDTQRVNEGEDKRVNGRENDMPQERTRESIRDNDRSDYSDFYDNEYDLDEDDRLYKTNMDKDVEWAGVGDKGKGVKDGTSAFHGTDEEDVHSDYAGSDELCSFDYSSSEDVGVNVRKPKFLEFRVATDMKNPSFKLGMLFGTTIELKAAVREYAIKEEK
ncbi:unnamed protein product [Ilex paraguariensis]|uniref:Transposase MuDR plant domain-containing protein n=1 Tax=Ilex paraguariensis TaxID=185542 RepID=A0ABC8V401_9AQUA